MLTEIQTGDWEKLIKHLNKSDMEEKINLLIDDEIKTLIKEAVELGVTIHWHGDQSREGSMGAYNVGVIGILKEWSDVAIRGKLREGLTAYKKLKGLELNGYKYQQYHKKLLEQKDWNY